MSGARIIDNPNGAFGLSALDGISRQEAELKAAGAITKGAVALGTDGTVTMAATNSTASLNIGIASGAVASGKIAKVVVQGVVVAVPCDGAVAAGSILKRSVTTTGSVAATASPAAGEAIGFALAASASNVCTMWVCKAL